MPKQLHLRRKPYNLLVNQCAKIQEKVLAAAPHPKARPELILSRME
jgi:hypothetical protein